MYKKNRTITLKWVDLRKLWVTNGVTCPKPSQMMVGFQNSFMSKLSSKFVIMRWQQIQTDFKHVYFDKFLRTKSLCVEELAKQTARPDAAFQNRHRKIHQQWRQHHFVNWREIFTPKNHWLAPNYTVWGYRHMRVNSMSKVAEDSGK